MNKLSSVLQMTVLHSVMLWAVFGVSAQAEEKKPTLSIERHDQTIEIKHSAEQNFGLDDFFYAMWVKRKAQCSADIKQSPQAGDYLCVLHTKKSLGADWQKYAIGVSPEPSGERSPVDTPPRDLPKPTSQPPKIQTQKCVLKTSGADNTETCTVKF